jgi:hypothetical protein
MIRIFVGCSANGEDAEAQAMLEYTLRKYASRPIEINWMKLTRDKTSPWYANFAAGEGWNTRGWATPFSAFRWAIPHVCNFEGKAIYVDVDMIARDDIAKLDDQPHPDGKAILAKNQNTHCVMLFDCARAKQYIPPFDQLRRTEGLYRQVRRNIGGAIAPFEGNWNCLDGESYKTLLDPDIKIIHFTKVETQPHLKWALPRLKASGMKHWNAHTLKSDREQPHARSDVAPLVDNLWKLTQAAGYTAEKYLGGEKFGNYDAVRGGQRAA